MNHLRIILITCFVPLLFSFGVIAQVPPATVTTPVHGHFTLPNRTTEAGDNLLWVNTYTGDMEPLLTNVPGPEMPHWSPTGELLAYHREYDGLNILFNSQSGQSQSIAVLEDVNTKPIGWSRDGANILYGDYSLDLTTYPYLPSYSFKIYNLTTETASTVAVLNFSQTLTGLPRPQGIGDFIVDIDTIYQIDSNPIYDQWIAFVDKGLDATILPDGTFPGESPPEEAILHDVILYNMVTGQLLSADVLIAEELDISRPITWSADGEHLLVHAGLSAYILNLQQVGSEWQLSVVASAEVNSQSALFWLGAGDLLISADIDDETGDSIYYIAEIIKGQWHSTEFVRVSSEIYKGIPGDWRLEATDAEKQTLTCLFDQTQPTQLAVGTKARVNFANGTPLRLHAEPDLDSAEIQQMPEGIEFDVVGGPACINADSYYRFWQLQLDDGTIGWATEADQSDYFIEPVPEATPALTE